MEGAASAGRSMGALSPIHPPTQSFRAAKHTLKKSSSKQPQTNLQVQVVEGLGNLVQHPPPAPPPRKQPLAAARSRPLQCRVPVAACGRGSRTTKKRGKRHSTNRMGRGAFEQPGRQAMGAAPKARPGGTYVVRSAVQAAQLRTFAELHQHQPLAAHQGHCIEGHHMGVAQLLQPKRLLQAGRQGGNGGHISTWQGAHAAPTFTLILFSQRAGRHPDKVICQPPSASQPHPP